jgi:hypothetical protein
MARSISHEVAEHACASPRVINFYRQDWVLVELCKLCY